MVAYVARRTAGHALVAIVAVSLVYLLAAVTLHPRGNYEGRVPRPPQAAVEARLSELNLNDRTPVLVRYRAWAAGVLRGDFGRTWEGVPVNALLWPRALVSLRLLALGTVAGWALGVAVGALAAVRGGGVFDRFTTLASFVVLAVPVFVLAVLLQLAAQWVNDMTGLRVFEWVGEFSPGGRTVRDGGLSAAGGGAGPAAGAPDGVSGAVSAASPGSPGIGDRLQHLVLPTVTIVLAQVAVYSRYQRGAMLVAIGAEHVRTAMAKGLRRRTALRRHALRTALVPVTTGLAYNVGLLLLGSVFIEKIFGWHGMGEWLVDSIAQGDVNVVAAFACYSAITVFAAGLLADAALAVLDPRTRWPG